MCVDKAPGPDDDRVVPLCDLLEFAWNRDQLPVLIAETSGMNEGREDWLRDIINESMAAVNWGTDLHGICLFPAVDRSDWHTRNSIHSARLRL